MVNEHAPNDFDVVIVGGGLGGLSLACALGHAGAHVALIERLAPDAAEDDAFDGRTTAIAFASAAFLRAIGVWDDDALDAQPIRDIIILDGRVGRAGRKGVLASGRVRFSETDRDDASPLGWIVENRRLRRRLREVATRSDRITLIAPAQAAAFDGSGGAATITLDTGRVVGAPLVVAADGRESFLRQAVDIDTFELTYDQTALVATVRNSLDHGGLAQELFLPAGPFAALPMTENRTSIVWTERSAAAPAYRALSDRAFLDEIDIRLGGCLGELELAGPRGAYPLTLMAARRFHGPRLALISEAAHKIHPIAGQGLNVGLRDVAALAELVGDALRTGEDIGAAPLLRRYDRWRRFDVTALAGTTDVLNRFFSHDRPMARSLRGFGLGAVQRAAPLRRLMMREAAGAVGRLPRLLETALGTGPASPEWGHNAPDKRPQLWTD